MKIRGFTIVELLIVIIVIAILAAISIVAYNSIQGRARDSQRKSDLGSVAKALELYHIDNGGYPICGPTTGTYTPGGTRSADIVQNCLTDELVPTYLSSLPTDPINSGAYRYRYAVGYKRNAQATGFSATNDDNYIMGTKLDTVSSPTYSGWGYSDLTYLVGSQN